MERMNGGTMLIQTTRFDTVNVTAEDVLFFPEGLLGFSDLQRFVLLDDPNDEIFAWLQSCEMPDVAFPVLEPELFSDQFQLSLTKHDLQALQAENTNRLRAFSIVTIPEQPKEMTANLKAPVIINLENRVGRQCVLQDTQLAIREPIFLKLQERYIQNPGSPLRSQAKEWGVRVTPAAPKPDPKTELSE